MVRGSVWRSTPLPKCSAGCPSSPNLLSSQGTRRCHRREERQCRAPGVGAYLPSFSKELFLHPLLCLGRGFCHPPACWVSVTCPRWVTGTRAAAPASRRAPGDSSPPSCSGRYQGTASACALWIGPAPCRPSDARRTGGLQDIPISPHRSLLRSRGHSAGGVFWHWCGMGPPTLAHPSQR